MALQNALRLGLGLKKKTDSAGERDWHAATENEHKEVCSE
jgi:hypothetical protein